jgi:hypothetical protein
VVKVETDQAAVAPEASATVVAAAVEIILPMAKMVDILLVAQVEGVLLASVDMVPAARSSSPTRR